MNPASPSESLCVACGLCCDGTLFRLVALRVGEADRIRAHSLVVSGVAGREHLKQPCAALDGTDCQIYADRPHACRAYRCALLRAVESGSTPADRAIELVKGQRGFVSRLVSAIGPGDLVETLTTLGEAGDDSATEVLAMLRGG